MEERPRNIPEDDTQEDIENEDGELSLNRRRLFLKNGFFREWLTSSSKESEDSDEDDEDEEKPIFGSGKKYKGFLSKIFEEEPASDEQEANEEPVFEFGDFSPDSPQPQSTETNPQVSAETTEVRIEHEDEPVQEPAEVPATSIETDEQPQEITQEYPEPQLETAKFTQEEGAAEPEDKVFEQQASFDSALELAEPAVVIEKQEAPRKDRSGALVAFVAAEILSRRRDRKNRKEIKKTKKNIESIEESLRTVKKSSEAAPKASQKEIIKDDKNTTTDTPEKKKTPEKTEKKTIEIHPEKTETKKEIVIEKTTFEAEQNNEQPAEVYFDKRHEVMGLEKPKNNDQEESKESLRETKQQTPVSVASVLASKQADQLEYIPAPIPLSKPGYKDDKETFEQKIAPNKSAYRESAETGFLIGLVVIGFIAVYVISR